MDEQKEKIIETNHHGGRRQGAGRPATGAMPTKAIRMTEEEYEIVKKFLADLRSKSKTDVEN